MGSRIFVAHMAERLRGTGRVAQMHCARCAGFHGRGVAESAVAEAGNARHACTGRRGCDTAPGMRHRAGRETTDELPKDRCEAGASIRSCAQGPENGGSVP